ncbi:protein phosphatase 1 regulatory subunit 12B [Achroia grisella]|uniref:protein phosphatase 1 regulatory subunit 12B n=1 Tax=Achroia grisella TaxID=688607 RepID=UPI0027D2AEDF|nr:protein phosphatase 1 regulatory subunit 12B [Achroia grisella]
MGLAAALLDAAACGDAARLASLLLADARQLNVADENGCSALQRASADGHVEVVHLLLQHGADPNKQDLVHGNTAAHEAAWKGYSRCVALLAGGGADLRARNAGGFTALHLACQNGHNQSCREILLAGAPPDDQNNYGDTALHTAARYGHAGVTRILISAQCRVSEQNKNGDTALHIAAAMGRRKLTRILLEAGCDKSLRNHQGETARDIATRKDLQEIISILNTPVAKQTKKKEKQRDKSKERTIDEPDDGKKKNKDKKKKNVHFETPPTIQWSPYGCHYYPDPKFFPKPKLSSLPTEPLKKGEQYYLDLAGNIKKGPIGAGYTCYCAPFFKHMEDKLNEDKKDLKRHIDRAHERLDQKVTDLEMKTQGQISELTRFVAAERALCKERHKHLEHWITRGMMFRASERIRKLDYSPKGSLDIAPLKRTRSLELLDTHAEEWSKVHKIIKSFNQNTEQYESNAKELNEKSKITSKSTEVLDSRKSPESPRRRLLLKNSRSSDHLDAGPSRSSRSPHTPISHTSPTRDSSHLQSVTAEIHVKANKVSVSQSPVSMEVETYNERYVSPSRQSNVRSPSSNRQSDYKASDSEGDNVTRISKENSQNIPVWKSQVLQRTADDIRKRVMLEKEMSDVIARGNTKSLDISQDGYVRLRKQANYPREENEAEREPRKSVQELVAQVEHQQRCTSPDPLHITRKPLPTEAQELPITRINKQPSPGILKMPQQPQRPAPVLKEKPPKSKRFSLHNLIPFPTRKTFQTPPKDNNGNHSESSDEEDNPIRSTNQPGPMRNANLLQTLPLPNFETMSNKSQSPAPQVQSNQNNPYVQDLRPMIPKDAYFHEIPNRQVHHQMPYKDMIDTGLPLPQYKPCQAQYDYNESGLPQNQIQARNRNPLYHHQTGVFDAMMQDHILREMDRIPHCYSEHLDQNTEVEIANQNDHFRGGYYDNCSSMYPNFRGNPHVMNRKPTPDHNLLHSRLQSLAINTHLTETQSQTDRESHNDSGYSTKVYGSSQGPSPSLSGHVECSDNLSGQRVNVVPNGKVGGQFGASSLV